MRAPLRNIYLRPVLLLPQLRADIWCDDADCKLVQETIPSSWERSDADQVTKFISWSLSRVSQTGDEFMTIISCVTCDSFPSRLLSPELGMSQMSTEAAESGPGQCRAEPGRPGLELQIPPAATHSASFPKNLPREHFSCVPAISQALQS